MTREEFDEILEQTNAVICNREWYERLIKAFEQEPCGDSISRVEVQKHIYRRLWESALNNVGYECKAEDVFMDIADNRLSTWVSEIPSIKPKPKTGHWEWVQYDYNSKLGDWHCSECKSVVIECVSKEEKGGIPLYKYCPQCGAKVSEIPTYSEKE